MSARISLKITDGERAVLAQWSNLVFADLPNGANELSFTGPDGAPWYLEIQWEGAVSMESSGPSAIEEYSDYDLTTEVYRRITNGAALEEHEPYMEVEG